MKGPVADILHRFVSAWTAQTRWTWVVVALAGACLMTLLPRFAVAWQRWLLWSAVLMGAVTFGGVYAWQLRWLCDDAFISFHYADNLARGLGLVFNPGEKIEGYTNFLWTMIMALAIRLGFDAGQVAVVLGLVCFGAATLVTGLLARRVSPSSDRAPLPIAAALLALNYSFASFATSGLETMFAALLITAALERAVAGRPLASGACAIGATMAHPDHAVLYGGLAFALYSERRSIRDLAWYIAPFVFIYVPYYAWRWHYYGEFFPNTYYAKSGADWYLGQGGLYILVCSLAAGLWGALPLATAALMRKRSTILNRYALCAIPAYLFYVAKVGGDFMLGRLLCSVIPVLAVLVEVGFYQLARTPHRRTTAALLLFVASAMAVRLEFIKPMEKAWHVADERTFYPLTSFAPVRVGSIYFEWGEALLAHFGSTPRPAMVAVGCVGMIGYLSRLPLLDTFGLTDRGVAHSPIAHRGRPGHEKSTSPGYILKRGASLSEAPIFPSPYEAWTEISVERTRYYLASYDPELLTPVRSHSGVTFVDMPRVIDQYLEQPKPKPRDEAACDLWFFDAYYLTRNEDPVRRARLVTQMQVYGVLPYDTEDLVLSATAPTRWERVSNFNWSFGGHQSIETGNAFASWPSSEVPAGQGLPFPTMGEFINTFQTAGGDSATGRLQSAPQLLDGEILLVKIAGGRDISNLSVSLVVDGDIVAKATGCNTELIGARAFDIRAYRGRQGYVLLSDDARGGWGHLVVDEVSVWRRR